MRRTSVLLVAGLLVALAGVWFGTGVVISTRHPDLGGVVEVVPVPSSTTSPRPTPTTSSTSPPTSATGPAGGANQVPAPPECPAGQTPDPDEDDPDDRCDD
jgi:hypothetical protein